MLTDAERGIYTRLVIAHNKIRGAIRYGDIRDGHWYLDLIEKGPRYPRYSRRCRLILPPIKIAAAARR